jgi:hypothetical protein
LISSPSARFSITLTLADISFNYSGFKAVHDFLGLASALGIIYLEHRLKRATLKRLTGACGSIMGIKWL